MFRHSEARRRGVVLDHDVDSDPRCLASDGACCRSFPTVGLTAEEYRRLEALGARRLEFALPRRYVLVIEFGCEFQGADGRCRIYADRPAVCRRFACVG